MSHSWEEIRNIMEARREQDGPLKSQMIEVRDRYNGDWVIPLPSVKGSPDMDPPVPRLVADGIDGLAMSAASTRPVANFPALDPGKQEGVRSREYARIRRRATYACWHRSQLELLLRRSFRHLAGYGEHALIVVPDFNTSHARIELRDPLTAYPEQRDDADVMRPNNVGFVYGRSRGWLLSRFPESARIINNLVTEGPNELWDVVEWIDEDDIVLGLLGPRVVSHRFMHRVREGEFGIELRRFPNRVGFVPGALGRRVTMDRVAGQMHAVLGTVDLMAKMMSLDVLAAEKAIFPDRFIIGADGRPPQLLSGEWKDGRTGKSNVLADVAQLGELQSSPGPLSHSVIDRLESAIRQSGGAHPFFSGMQPNSSLRTGRAIDSFGQATVHPKVAELQETMSRSLTLVNEAFIEMEKAYWPSKKYVEFSGWAADRGHVEYEPDKHFETANNVVSYDFPGMDPQSSGVTVAQLVGSGMMSKKTGMTKHPWVEDPEHEYATVWEEGIDSALLASLQQNAAGGALPVTDVARIKQLIMEGSPLEDAIIQANREAQERQAAQAPPPQEGFNTAPEQQPGLAPPGAGQETGPPAEAETIQPPDQSLQNFRQMLVALRNR